MRGNRSRMAAAAGDSGAAGDYPPESAGRFRLPTVFPEAALREAAAVPDRVLPGEVAGREDWRGSPVFTVDPDDARDFDDAVAVAARVGGGWRMQVHIADVAHYVRPGSALDAEAYRRGTSVYLPDRVLPMLPEPLSDGICSLRPHEDRLVRSVLIEFDAKGVPLAARFLRGVIRSGARLTYPEALVLLARPPVPGPGEWLHRAWELAAVLRRRRFAAGALDLDLPELKVRVDGNGRAVALERVESDRAHQLIEELMLAANEAVARAVRRRLLPSLYRVHEPPDPEKLREFRELARQHGYPAGDLGVRRELLKLMGRIRGGPAEEALKRALLRSLARARYAAEPLGHYGLAKASYTHFTSPIRRYADLVVHRVAAAVLERPTGAGSDGGTGPARPASGETRGGAAAVAPAALPVVAEHISAREQVAAAAEWDAVDRQRFEFFQGQIARRSPQEFAAVVVEVRAIGLFVELPAALTGGLVPVAALADDRYRFDRVRRRLIGQRWRRTIGVGDRLRVIVARVDPDKRLLDFAPVT